MEPFIIYLICAVVCGLLHWAKHQDDVKDNQNCRTMQEKVIYLYLIPLIPFINALAIVYAFAVYIGLAE